MTYFSPQFLKFFKDLSKNNSTQWFNENRKTYEKEVKKPFNDFVAELIKRIQKYEPEIQIKPADAIMRINKDIRFSKDKTPYNTYMAANISLYGKKDKSYPGFYVQLSPEGIQIFGGAYQVEPHTLQHMRTYMAAHLKDFAAAYNEASFKEKFGKLEGEQSKRIPPEFKSVFAQEPLIANKQFYFSARLKTELIESPKLADELMTSYLAAKKVNQFLQQAIKP